MIQYYLKSSIIVLILIALQLTIIPMASINGITPDIVVIYVIIFALRYGQIKGTFLGFTVGLFYDLFSGGLLGSAMFSKTLAGFVAGYFHKDDDEDIYSNTFLFAVIIFISSFIDSLFYAILGSAEVELNLFSLLFTNGIFPAVYTSLVGIAYSLFARNK